MKAPTIDQWIESQAGKIRQSDIDNLRSLQIAIKEKTFHISEHEYPRLVRQIEVMISMLPEASEPLSQVLKECAVALSYLLRKYDRIPDDLAEIGYKDDALVCDRVCVRNRGIAQFKDLQP